MGLALLDAIAPARLREDSMDFSAWRGTLGIVRPTYRPGGMEELIKMMPDGIGVIPLFADVREGTNSPSQLLGS